MDKKIMDIIQKKMMDLSYSISNALCKENDLDNLTAPMAIMMLEKYAKEIRDINPEYGEIADALKKLIKTDVRYSMVTKFHSGGAKDNENT